MKLAFAGTPEFAVPSLRAVAEAGHEVRLVVTQPDRPRGRGLHLVPPPVKVEAKRLGLPVWQPESPQPEELANALRRAEAEALVVVAFAHKIPPEVLSLPRYGCINVHASLLPRWRGASPIAHAILEGDRLTGVTIMQMNEGWDTGPILLQATEPIGPADTAASLHDRLAAKGATLLVEALSRLEAGTIRPLAQPPSGATSAPRLRREDGAVDWSRPAERIERQIRAFTPWPGAYTALEGKLLKLVEARVETGRAQADPGELVAVDAGDASILVGCGEGSLLRVTRVQPEGSRVMTGLDLANGMRLKPGQRFSSQG